MYIQRMLLKHFKMCIYSFSFRFASSRNVATDAKRERLIKEILLFLVRIYPQGSTRMHCNTLFVIPRKNKKLRYSIQVACIDYIGKMYGA